MLRMGVIVCKTWKLEISEKHFEIKLHLIFNESVAVFLLLLWGYLDVSYSFCGFSDTKNGFARGTIFGIVCTTS